MEKELFPVYFNKPVECTNEPYEGVPSELTIDNPADYIQPWSGFEPECTLEDKNDCKRLPIQTSNIKIEDIYADIEVKSNHWIEMAGDLARESVAEGGGPFGAVIVQIDDETNEVIRYWKNHNQVTAINDPTAHAEVVTIRNACHSLGVFDLSCIKKEESKLPQQGATSHCEIYSSTEPCPMCYSAISWAKMPRLFFAATRFDAAQQGVSFSDEEIYSELKKSYANRKMKVFQCSTPNSLDAFNLWKRSNKIHY